MAVLPRTPRTGISCTGRRFPLPGIVHLVASVQFAAVVIAGLALLGLVGVLVPQVPEGARASPNALNQWLQSQEGSFGPAVDGLYRLGLFDVFHSVWLAAGLVLLATSVVACTAQRLVPTWRNVVHPVKVVPDGYLDHAHQRVLLDRNVDADVLEQALRRRHYKVERWQAGQSEWLFADRYPWAQLGTFLSHIAIILLIVAGLVTHFTGFSTRLFIPEEGSEPIFPVGHSPGVNVVLNASKTRLNSTSASLGSRSEITITRNGTDVKDCTITATQPCSYNGYRIRQALYFPFGADIQIRDLNSGRVVYRETVALTGSRPVPRLVVTDSAGKVLFDQPLTFTGTVGNAFGTSLALPGIDRSFWAGMAADEPTAAAHLVIFEPGGRPGALRLTLPLHGESTVDGLRFSFAALAPSPAASVQDMPLPPGNRAQAVPPELQLLGADGSADSFLSLSGVGPQPLSLHQGESVRVGGLEYTFLKQRPFLGIEVTKDRGEPLIWMGSGMLVVGLCTTMWLPRRRLWAKVSADGLRMAGIAPRMANFRRELEAMATETADASFVAAKT